MCFLITALVILALPAFLLIGLILAGDPNSPLIPFIYVSSLVLLGLVVCLAICSH